MNRPRFPRRFALVLLAALLGAAAAGRAQDTGTGAADASSPAQSATPPEPPSGAYTPASEPGVEGLERLRTLPSGSFYETPPGLPYSSVLNTTGADVNDINVVGGHPINTDFATAPKIGGVEGNLLIEPVNGGLFVPFVRHGPDPENADLKVGPLYVKFHSVEGLVLYDDNFDLTQTNRKSELLALIGLNLSVIAQLSDDLQLAVSGTLIYLPIQNDFGVQSSIFDSLGLLATGPLLAAQLVYDTNISGWPVRFADDFRSGTAIYSDSARDNFDLFHGDYLDRTENGRYTLLAARDSQKSNGFNVNPQSSSLIYFSNTISALTDRLLPGDIRLTVRPANEELWYNQSNRGLPSSRDDLFISLVSERENQRFKPYTYYDATYVDGIPGVTQSLQAGVFGPIDDQIFMRIQGGYYLDGVNHQGALYLLRIDHDAGPYTSQHLVADRQLSYFDQEVQTAEYYNLQQILGPTLVASLFVANASYEELVNFGVANHTEQLGGIELAWNLGPKTEMQFGGIYERQHYSSGVRFDIITGRAILNRAISDTLSLQILYEYQHSVSNAARQSFYNNVIYLRMMKSFD